MEETINIKDVIGTSISELRLAKGMTQQQLADKIGINRVSIARLECGQYNVSIDILHRILTALDAKLSIIQNNTI